MLVFSPLCDALGMGKVLALAWLCHLLGISGTIFAEEVADPGVRRVGRRRRVGGVSAWMTDTFSLSLLPDVAGGEHQRSGCCGWRRS